MKLCVYCAGGYGREVFDIAARINAIDPRWDEVLFLDDTPNFGDAIYLGRLFTLGTMLKEFNPTTFEIIVANGEPANRKKIFERVKRHNLAMATLADPLAIISPTACIGEGVIVSQFSSISSSAVIGNNVTFNANCIVGHDATVGDHSVISSLVSLGGECSVGEKSYVAMGVQVKEKISIGSNVIIGMGSAVFNDIPDNVIAMGNPARPLRRNEGKMVFDKPRK